MWDSAVFCGWVREVAGLGRGIGGCGPNGEGSHLGGALHMVGGPSSTKLWE